MIFHSPGACGLVHARLRHPSDVHRRGVLQRLDASAAGAGRLRRVEPAGGAALAESTCLGCQVGLEFGVERVGKTWENPGKTWENLGKPGKSCKMKGEKVEITGRNPRNIGG